MAIKRDGHYRDYMPDDTRELVEQLREMGVDVKDPLWTVGRLDERGPDRHRTDEVDETPSERRY